MNEIEIKVLSGHTSPETAYVVSDYPYGFRLRCAIRYWLEFVPKKGVRLWSQTTNPKRAGEPWNKPKASTFCRFGGAMFLDDAGHVKWSGVNEYHSAEEIGAWLAQFEAGVPAACLPSLKAWHAGKVAYQAARDAGEEMAKAAVAGMEAMAAYLKANS